MGKSYKSLSLFDFQQRFMTANQCLAYLAAEKWKNGYVCTRCGHSLYCQGNTLYSRQCTRCKYTASHFGYAFHKVKANVKTDKWLVYKPLKNEFESMTQLSSGEKGGNFPEIHRAIMLFKAWLIMLLIYRHI